MLESPRASSLVTMEDDSHIFVENPGLCKLCQEGIAIESPNLKRVVRAESPEFMFLERGLSLKTLEKGLNNPVFGRRKASAIMVGSQT